MDIIDTITHTDPINNINEYLFICEHARKETNFDLHVFMATLHKDEHYESKIMYYTANQIYYVYNNIK